MRIVKNSISERALTALILHRKFAILNGLLPTVRSFVRPLIRFSSRAFQSRATGVLRKKKAMTKLHRRPCRSIGWLLQEQEMLVKNNDNEAIAIHYHHYQPSAAKLLLLCCQLEAFKGLFLHCRDWTLGGQGSLMTINESTFL